MSELKEEKKDFILSTKYLFWIYILMLIEQTKKGEKLSV